MRSLYFIIFSYAYFWQYFFKYLAKSLHIDFLSFLSNKKNAKNILPVKEISFSQKILRRINRLITDNTFFIWLKSNKSLFKKYGRILAEKNTIIEDPHISIVAKDTEYQDYKIYRQVNKEKYSRVV